MAAAGRKELEEAAPTGAEAQCTVVHVLKQMRSRVVEPEGKPRRRVAGGFQGISSTIEPVWIQQQIATGWCIVLSQTMVWAWRMHASGWVFGSRQSIVGLTRGEGQPAESNRAQAAGNGVMQ